LLTCSLFINSWVSPFLSNNAFKKKEVNAISTAKNKATIRRFIEEVFNKGNIVVVDEIIASNYVNHSFKEQKGQDGLKQFVTQLRTAFPDLHVTIEDIVAESDMLAYRIIFRGTFKGEWGGMTLTGKQLTIPEAYFVRFEGDKVVEESHITNMLTFYQQLGVSPPGG
jgi:predicted ester cyclase